MKRLAVFHPNLSSKGGGEAVCMNVLAALEDHYDVTLYTVVKPDLDDLNAYYNTNVWKIEINRLGSIGAGLGWLAERANDAADVTFGRLQSAVLNRFLDRQGFDLVISTYNEFSFETPAIQYVHYPNFGVERESLVYKVYDRLCDAIDGFDKNRIRESTLFANSEWTASVFADIYGVTPNVLYPPVDTTEFNPVPWDERESGFITIGRVEPSKRVLQNIRIVERLCERGHDVHLHVVGPAFHGKYAERVRERAEQSPFVSIEGEVSRERLVELVCTHRYGLHGKENEHFGMVVAELAAGGTIPFVPNSGGQTEIVDNNQQLCYDNIEEAVANIDQVLSSPELEQTLRKSLPDVTAQYGRESFQAALRESVETKLAEIDQRRR